MQISTNGLSNQQISQFQDEGYVIVEDVFDPEDLEPIRLELEREIGLKIDELVRNGDLAESYPDEPFERRLTRIYHDSKENGEAIMNVLEGMSGGGYSGRGMFDLLTHPKLLDAVAPLVGSEIVASSTPRSRMAAWRLFRGPTNRVSSSTTRAETWVCT